jgi:hypothetical protein
LLPASSGQKHDYQEYGVCFCEITVPIYQTTERQNPEYYNSVISRSEKGGNKRGSKKVNKKAKQNGDEILCVEVRRVMKDGYADSRDAPFGVCFAKIRTVDSTALRNVTAAANQK